MELGNINKNYVDFAKSHEKNYRIFESNWETVETHNNNNNYKLQLNKFADKVDFNTENYHSDLMNKTITYKTCF